MNNNYQKNPFSESKLFLMLKQCLKDIAPIINEY